MINKNNRIIRLKLIELNGYFEKELVERRKLAEYWKQELEDNGDILITDIELTFGDMYNKAVIGIENLKNELEENNILIKFLEENEILVTEMET